MTRSRTSNDARRPPLVAHVIFRLDTGGLENGLVNIINGTPADSIRHAIICITYASSFKNRIESDDVEIIELHKKPGKGLTVYWRFWREIRRLKPDVVHTRNVNSLEFQVFAMLAGARARIHGEHGWDTHDLHGKSWKFRTLRRLLQPFVHQFITVSRDLQTYLTETVGIRREKIMLIHNGVDVEKFHSRACPAESGSVASRVVVGAVGRIKHVKNHRLLVDAFLNIVGDSPENGDELQLLIIGDGPLRQELIERLNEAGAGDLSSLPGSSENVAELLQGMDIFVSPSLNEGISNTILEAMASGLPVIATRVGGTEEIVQHDVTGTLVKSDDVAGLASAIRNYVNKPKLRRMHGEGGRASVEDSFSQTVMVRRYLSAYEAHLG